MSIKKSAKQWKPSWQDREEILSLSQAKISFHLAVMAAMGSVLTNKYAEGYSGKRYYGGCQCVDVVEDIAVERACKLFGAKYANVQPHSGAQANTAVYFALLKPGDTVMGMSLDAGGHPYTRLTLNLSGKYFNFVPYGVNDEGYIDYEAFTSRLTSADLDLLLPVQVLIQELSILRSFLR